jgi:hypothetical protein
VSLLDDFSRFSAISSVHAFPKMRLMARDHEPDLVAGSGELRVVSANRFEFTLIGEPENPAYVFEQMRRQQDDRYDGLSRFRLVLEEDDGTAYAGGWTVPSFRTGDGAWTFEGETESFMGGGRSELTPTGSTEDRFLIPTRHHAAQMLAHFVTTPRDRLPPEPRFDLEVMGQTVTFRFDRALSMLTISTPAPESLPLTYTENWLGEPLRILFGQLVFPRMVARVQSDGHAMLAVRPSPPWTRDSDWTALWIDETAGWDKAGFWTLYAALLTHVASARTGDGRNFEASPVTHFHEEVIQAARGSRWVWAMTLASSIEGLVSMLYSRGTRREHADLNANTQLICHIRAWSGDHALKEAAIRAVQRTAEVTTAVAMRALVADAAITRDQVKAWQKVRHAVMHGNLVSPYSSQEDDETLIALADLMRALIRHIVGLGPVAGDAARPADV